MGLILKSENGDEMRNIYTSIEIVNQSIRLVVAELIADKLHVLSAKETYTNAIKHGEVKSPSILTKDIVKLKNETEDYLKMAINKALVLINASNAQYQLVEGQSTITNADKLVKADDISRVMQACVYNKIAEAMELITVLPIEFMVDSTKVSRPINRNGNKITAKAVMITVPKINVYPVVQAIDNAGIETIDLCVSPIADYFYTFYHETNQRRGIIVNINNDTTTIGYYNKGIVINSETIFVGVNNIISDLAYVFDLSSAESKKLYERFALSTTRLANVNETMSVINQNKEELNLNQYEVSEVVMARLAEIFKLAKMSIKHLTSKEINYIMFTGVGSETPGFKSLLNETVGTGIKIASVNTMGARNNGFISTLGSIYYFAYKLQLKGKRYTMYEEPEHLEEEDKGIVGKMLNIFKDEEE